MQKYEVIIEETVSKSFIVQANSKEEATQITKDKYNAAEFVLDPGELIDLKIGLLNESGIS